MLDDLAVDVHCTYLSLVSVKWQEKPSSIMFMCIIIIFEVS